MLSMRHERGIAADDDDCGFAQTEEVGRLRFDAYPHREPRSEMDPVKGTLHIGQTRRREAPNQVGVRSDPETHAVHYTLEMHVRFRQDIDVCLHAGVNVLELRFTEIRDGPPYACINQREDVLSGRRIGAL